MPPQTAGSATVITLTNYKTCVLDKWRHYLGLTVNMGMHITMWFQIKGRCVISLPSIFCCGGPSLISLICCKKPSNSWFIFSCWSRSTSLVSTGSCSSNTDTWWVDLVMKLTVGWRHWQENCTPDVSALPSATTSVSLSASLQGFIRLVLIPGSNIWKDAMESKSIEPFSSVDKKAGKRFIKIHELECYRFVEKRHDSCVRSTSVSHVVH